MHCWLRLHGGLLLLGDLAVWWGGGFAVLCKGWRWVLGSPGGNPHVWGGCSTKHVSVLPHPALPNVHLLLYPSAITEAHQPCLAGWLPIHISFLVKISEAGSIISNPNDQRFCVNDNSCSWHLDKLTSIGLSPCFIYTQVNQCDTTRKT